MSRYEKIGALREIRLALLREAALHQNGLASVADLQKRFFQLLAEVELVGALVRAQADASLEIVMDAGLIYASGKTNPTGLSVSAPILEQVLGKREAVVIKASESQALLFGEGASGAENGLAKGMSALLIPVSSEMFLLLAGDDLGHEDIASTEELAQVLLLLWQNLLNSQQQSSRFSELQDSVQRLGETVDQDRTDLQDLLEASKSLRSSTDLESTLRQIGELIRTHSGYDIVAISLIEGKLAHNKVLLGVAEDVRSQYAGMTSTLEDLEPFFDERFRISNSYYVPQGADVYTKQNEYCLYCPKLEARPPGMWQSGDNFLIPLRDSEARLIGLISLDAPRDGLPPTAQKAPLLELYAVHAARSIESERRMQELTTMNQELRDLDRIRNEFVANISHELRTPVASILGYAHLLLDHGSENLTDRQTHFLSVLSRNTERLNTLVDNLVDLSGLNTETPVLKTEPLDLRDIYHEVLARLESQNRAHHLSLHEHLGEEALLVLGDRHRLRQIFFSVLSNAVLFNRDGGVVEIEMERISPTMISARISDTGLGLSKDKLHEILDRFYQVDHAQVPLEAANTLGLSLAYKHVRAHRGNLVLQSEEGSGTRVMVTLPALSSF